MHDFQCGLKERKKPSIELIPRDGEGLVNGQLKLRDFQDLSGRIERERWPTLTIHHDLRGSLTNAQDLHVLKRRIWRWWRRWWMWRWFVIAGCWGAMLIVLWNESDLRGEGEIDHLEINQDTFVIGIREQRDSIIPHQLTHCCLFCIWSNDENERIEASGCGSEGGSLSRKNGSTTNVDLDHHHTINAPPSIIVNKIDFGMRPNESTNQPINSSIHQLINSSTHQLINSSTHTWIWSKGVGNNKILWPEGNGTTVKFQKSYQIVFWSCPCLFTPLTWNESQSISNSFSTSFYCKYESKTNREIHRQCCLTFQ